MSINALIDATVRCSICGKPPSAKCTCHDPKDPVLLVCIECPKRLKVEREPDFFDFKEIETLCPECTKDPEKLARYKASLKPARKEKR